MRRSASDTVYTASLVSKPLTAVSILNEGTEHYHLSGRKWLRVIILATVSRSGPQPNIHSGAGVSWGDAPLARRP